MKRISKILALMLALCMLLSVAAFASAEPAGAASGEASGEAMSAEEAYKEYLHEWLLAEDEINDTMLPEQVDEFMAQINAGIYDGAFPVEMLWSGMLNSGSPMTFEEFAAQYDGAASGEASGEAMSAEEAYKEYLHEWLLAEDEINDTMLPEQVDEFMAQINAGIYDGAFPVEMLWSGMLNSGSPMTFEEFEAQYVPAAGASGEASGEGYTADEAGYKAYLKDWVAANPAVQANIGEFNAAIDAGAYTEFPMEMCFTDQWFGFAAMTLDEFIAAGGVAEIPAFDPNLTPD